MRFHGFWRHQRTLILFALPFFMLANTAQAERSGDKVFNTYCIACHMTGAAGAPRLGDHTSWQPRIEKGLSVLLETTVSGIGAMPPRGMCSSCSDTELEQAIQFILDNSK